MSSLIISFVVFMLINSPESAVSNDYVAVPFIQIGSCKLVISTRDIIDLKSLQRSDGLPRFMTTFVSSGKSYNYTFNPCLSHNMSQLNTDVVQGDGCYSIAVCKFNVKEQKQYFTLGLQNYAKFRVIRDIRNNHTNSALVFTGDKSVQQRKTIIKLICDATRKEPDDGLFKIIEDSGVGNVIAELHHLCCCPNGCLTVNNSERSENRKSSDMFIMFGAILSFLFMALIIGFLCYLSRTHLPFYYKLPVTGKMRGFSHHSPNDDIYDRRLTAPSLMSVRYRDYEPGWKVSKKSQLPVLENAVMSIDTIKMRQRLGGGSFGDTHVAEWHDMTVALKRLTINIHDNQVTDDIIELMKKEVWFLSRQRHKNIVGVLGLCIDSRHPCIITEFVNGSCIKDLLKMRDFKLIWPHRVKICSDVANGIAFLHSTKPPIIHRDLRCGNLFLLHNDTAKVADFGLTKMIQPLRQNCTKEDCCCRRNYSACPANIRWTAPEILQNPTVLEDDAVITTAADVYSFGLVMWELFVCEDPFEDIVTEEEVIELVNRGSRPRLNSVTNMMPQYKDLMQSCWSQHSKDRPTIKKVVQTLKNVQNQSGSFQKIIDRKIET